MGQIIIVEGKSDTRRLKEVFGQVMTFETSGLGLDDKKLAALKRLAVDHELIVFTDPDGPGEIIRARLNGALDDLAHAYLPNNKAISKKRDKVGVEHASCVDIKIALSNCKFLVSDRVFEYEIEDLIDWKIYNSKSKRLLFCDGLNIAFGNNQKVLSQLNNYQIDLKKIKDVLEKMNVTS